MAEVSTITNSNSLTIPRTTLIDAMDKLNDGIIFLRALELAVEGMGFDDPMEGNALAHVIGQVEYALLESAGKLEELNNLDRQPEGQVQAHQPDAK
jgi:hypothetical protein